MQLGLDLGAVAVKAVVTDRGGQVVARAWTSVTTGPDAALRQVLQEVRPALGQDSIRIGVTGQGRAGFASRVGGCAVENEVLALVRGVASLAPYAGAVIEIGGQSSRWISLDRDAGGALRLDDFALNDQCAAGAGAFLVQQAGRLHMDVVEFARLAAGASAGPSIAGRCAVFAKTDMIHLQQKGVPLDEIALGLCLALARNFVATVLKGREVRFPVALAGGGALNPGLVRAFREVLGLTDQQLLVMAEPLFVGALGAAHMATERAPAVSWDVLAEACAGEAPALPLATLDAVVLPERPWSVRKEASFTPPAEAFQAWLGVDVGSVSTDFALVTPDGTVVDGIYLPTRGCPIDVLDEGLSILRRRHGDRLAVLGLGTTGSGRHLAARLLGADLAKNEITAQLAGAVHFFPDVDTVLEIGGQDSKFIHVASSHIADFHMNKVCAAGTGSFLEEQCEILGLDVKRDFARLAARSTQPADLGARCTVFMETALVNARRAGSPMADLVAGLADSVARNYLQLVVGSHAIGRTIVFQGGVASNSAVVAAFERLLGRPVSVHPYNCLSGAIGVALLTRDEVEGARRNGSEDILPDAATAEGEGVPPRRLVTLGPHQARTFECHACENRCQVTQVTVGDTQAYFGDTCERYTIRNSTGAAPHRHLPDLFGEREAWLTECLQQAAKEAGRGRGRVGLPRASVVLEYVPFWAAFFARLGFEVVLSPPSSSQVLELGTRHLPAETCLPIRMTFGHVASLRAQGVDIVFLPSPSRFEDRPGHPAYSCPYSQAMPFMARSAMADRILTPEVPYGTGFREFAEGMGAVASDLGLPLPRLQEAFEAGRSAQAEFHRRLQDRGRDVLSGDFASALVVLGRPYNLFDPFLNLHLARHLQRLGVLAVPQGFLPGTEGDTDPDEPDLPWRFPREALRAARWAARDPRLHLVLVTNFGCGPDAFLQKHLASALPHRPALVLEFDEHRGEAGMVTRLEAFLDKISRPRIAAAPAGATCAPPRSMRESLAAPLAGRRIFVPYFADHAHALVGALRHQGADVELLPVPDDEVRKAGEAMASGKECHAYAMVVGDLVRLAARRGDGEPATFFYIGTSVPCLMSQFADGFRMDLMRKNLGGMEVLAPAWWEMLELLGMDGADQLWRGLVATDLLVRWMCGHRPYEVEAGSVDRVHRENLADLVDALAVDDMGGFLKRALERMQGVRVDRSEARPLVGVAGDLYTRINDAANLGLWARLEAQGCEVWPAPFLVDTVEFGLPHEFNSSLRNGRYRDALIAGLLMLRKDIRAWRIRRSFSPYLERAQEPDHAEVLRLTAPYLGPGLPYPLLLNVAKMVDFARRGADGIVHAICLNCMLGTTASALIDRIRKDHDGIPMANMIYSGADNAVLRTKLETFVHQVRAFRESRLRRGRENVPARPVGFFDSWFS